MVMEPEVTSVPGRPIRAWASVLLPEPLGPMITCTSPLRTVRSMPCRTSLPPAVACRSRDLEHVRRPSREHHRDVVALHLRPRRRRPAAWPAASRARRSAGRRCCRGGGTRSGTPRPRPRPRTASSPRGCTRRRPRRTRRRCAPARCGGRDVEAPRLAGGQVVGRAQRHGLRHRRAVLGRPARRRGDRAPHAAGTACTSGTGERSMMASKNPRTIRPSAISGATPRDSM